MNETRLISDVAEIAVASNSWNEFCGEFVKLYGRFGAESVAFVSVRSFQEVQVTSSVQEDNQPLNASMSRYLSQMSRGELDRALVPRTVGVDEIHPVARREQLGLYTEFLYPRGVHRFALRMWRGASSVHWFASTFPRIGRRRYEALTLAAMDHVFPIVALTERLYAPADRAETGEITREASLRYHLTQAEHDTMCLVGRGLTNSEIASLCGVALPTIRNRIVSCFKKLQVSRRTEAAYILIEASRALPLDPPAQRRYRIWSIRLKSPSLTKTLALLEEQTARPLRYQNSDCSMTRARTMRWGFAPMWLGSTVPCAVGPSPGSVP
jgi:DNA-binding CsgD family transcriptional regulator